MATGRFWKSAFYWRNIAMMGIGFPELMIILVIIMIIFGAGKLPEIGSAFGRSIKNFKTSMKEAEEAGAVEGGENAQGELEEGQPDLENMTEQEKEAYLRKKAEEEGEAKDKKMKDEADSFTASLPRKGSYDYSQDQENKA
jgi:TatA/E family protein of Tat protein translocase|tara:strand:+ start:6799 stop:7221 length:423 start_codon:yes stop_codon:yes gene_type:complete